MPPMEWPPSTASRASTASSTASQVGAEAGDGEAVGADRRVAVAPLVVEHDLAVGLQ